MSDDFLGESLRRAADGEPPVGDAWSRFQRTRSRGNFIRGVVVSTLALGAFVAMVFALPGLNANDAEPFAGGGEFEPSPTTVKTYTDPIAGFEFDYPSDWVIDGSPGKDVIVHPRGEYSRTSYCESCDPVTTTTPLLPYLEIDIDQTAPAALCRPAPCGVLGEVGDDPTVTQTTKTESVDGREMYVFDFVTVAASATPRHECDACHITQIHFDRNWVGGTGARLVTLTLTYPERRHEQDVVAAIQIVDSFRHPS